MTENTNTWRDVEGLTPEQTESMEHMEQTLHRVVEHPQAQQSLYDQAAYLAELNVIDARYADVPAPAGATTDAEGWGQNAHTGVWNRSVEWAQFDTTAPAVSVYIDGSQYLDGTYSRDVALYAEDCKLTAAQAREVARALMAAADRLDRLNEDTPPFM